MRSVERNAARPTALAPQAQVLAAHSMARREQRIAGGDGPTDVKVYEALASAFAAEGVTTVFGLMGAGNIYWWTALDRRAEVTLYQTRHEGAALSMAEGWARATGDVGVAAVTQGPGVTQLATALVVAARNEVPIVVFAGASTDENAVQYLDQRRFVEATGAGFVGLASADEVEDAVRRAFYRARVESRPVLLNVPTESQQREYDGELDAYRPSKTLLPAGQRIAPEPERLREAARLLAASRRPVIVAGRGAVAAGAAAAVERLAQRVGALIATTLPTKGWLHGADYHAGIAGLFSTRTAIELFAESDCVVGVGASLNSYTTDGGHLFPNARYIHVDRKPHLLMGDGRRADCYMQSDARLAVEALEERLAREGVSSAGYRTPEVRDALRSAVPDPQEFEIEPGAVDPRKAAALLDERLPAEVGLLVGVDHFWQPVIFSMRRPRARQEFLTGFGCIGQALPTAIGAVVGLRGGPLAVIDGDASALMHIQELDTAARVRANLLIVVFNDQALGTEYHHLRAKGIDAAGSLIATPDLGAVTRAFGCQGTLARSLDEVAAGVEEFLSGEGPMLLDVRVSRKVVGVPRRRIHFGEDV